MKIQSLFGLSSGVGCSRSIKIARILRLQLLMVLPGISALGMPQAKRLSDWEAKEIVTQRAELKRQAREAKRELLESAVPLEQSVATYSDQVVTFNRVEFQPKPTVHRTEKPSLQASADFLSDDALAEWQKQQDKPLHNFTISGEVYNDGISEIWWLSPAGRNYRVFTNANFLHLAGVGQFEDEDARYSAFMVVTPNHRDLSKRVRRKWGLFPEDFTDGEIEYVVAQPRRIRRKDEKHFKALEAILQVYAEDAEELKIAYENRLKIREAELEFDKQNPPVKHDVTVNFAPLRGDQVQ